MALTRNKPNTIILSGSADLVDGSLDNRFRPATGVSLIPGMVVEMIYESGIPKWRPHSSATRALTLAVVLDRPALDTGDRAGYTIDDPYPATDGVNVWRPKPGNKFWGLIGSGANIHDTDSSLLQSAGDGTLKPATALTADAGLVRFQAEELPGSVTVLTRCRVNVL